jgi:hypothetical protein
MRRFAHPNTLTAQEIEEVRRATVGRMLSVTRVEAKAAPVVFYLYTSTAGHPCASAFIGKSLKPAWNYRFKTDDRRAAEIAKTIENVKASHDYKAQQKAKASEENKIRSYKVGDLFKCSWGYEQTNVDFYELVELRGETMGMVRSIAGESITTGHDQGKVTPLPGSYIGEAFKVRLRGGPYPAFKIRHSMAFLLKPEIVGGVPVYGSAFWSSYA